MNNLKQLGLAVHNYIQSNDVIPPGGSWTGSGAPASGSGFPTSGACGQQTASMKVRLLPFLEQQAIYNSYNFSGISAVSYSEANKFGGNVGTTTTGFQNVTVFVSKVSGFICPSDANPGNQNTITTGLYAATTVGTSNYPNNLGMEPITTGRLNGPTWFIGGVGTTDTYAGSRVSLAAVQDGTSNTVVFSEWVKGNNGANRLGNGLIYTGGSMTGNATALSQTDVLTCQNSTTASYDFKGELWSQQDTGRGGGYWHIMFPNKKSCVGTASMGSATGELGALIGPSSYHSGGVNMLFLDGSVKFIKDSISAQPYYGIATVAGGEVVSADQY